MMTIKTGGGSPYNEESDADAPIELDPMGNSVGLQNQYPDEAAVPTQRACADCDTKGIAPLTNDNSPRNTNGQRNSYEYFGIKITHALAVSIMDSDGGMFRRMQQQLQPVVGWKKESIWRIQRGETGVRVSDEDGTFESDPIPTQRILVGYAKVPIYGDAVLGTSQAMVPSEQQQRSQQGSGEDGTALDILKQFINRNPRCKEAMMAAAKARKLENYETFLDKVKFYDMTQEGMMDRKGFFEKPEATANSSKITEAAGLAPPNTDNILLFNGYYRSPLGKKNPRPDVRRGTWADGKGDIVFHEFLHTYFNEDHVDLINRLGINPPKAPKDDKFGDYTKKELEQNSTARDAINSWINSGCAAVYTMRAGS